MQPPDAQQRLWDFLSPERQQFLIAHRHLTTDQKAGFAMELSTRVVFNPAFSDPDYWQHVPLPEDLTQLIALRQKEPIS